MTTALIVSNINRTRKTWQRVSITDWVVIGLVAFIFATALIAPVIAPDSIYTPDVRNALLPPSAEHWMGTDALGRDVLWRVAVGTRTSLFSALLVVACYAVIGIFVATLASVGGKLIDDLLMRATDIIFALPVMVVGLGFAAALGPSLKSAIIAMILVGWPYSARVLRAVTRQTMVMPYIEGATVLGVSRFRLMVRHVLPNSLDIMIVKWASDVGLAVMLLSSLSFLGVGAQAPSVEWGAMVADARSFVATAWWTAAAPGLAITITVVAFGLLGDFIQQRRNPLTRDA